MNVDIFYEVKFSFEGNNYIINFNINEKSVGLDLCQLIASEIRKDIDSLIFLYQGNKLDGNKSLNSQIKKIDKEAHKIYIMVYEYNNNYNIVFIYKKSPITIQCTKNDKMVDIINKFLIKSNLKIDSLKFICKKRSINLNFTDQKLLDFLNKEDEDNNDLTIYVYDDDENAKVIFNYKEMSCSFDCKTNDKKKKFVNN